MTDKQQQWQTLAIEFAQKINDYVDRGSREGWDSVGEQPEAPQLDDALPALLDALRSANQGSVRQDIKAQWPISYEMLHSLLNDNGQNIPMLCALPDGSLLARLGAIYAPGRVLHIQGDTVTELADIEFLASAHSGAFMPLPTFRVLPSLTAGRGRRLLHSLGRKGLKIFLKELPYYRSPTHLNQRSLSPSLTESEFCWSPATVSLC